MSNVNPCFVTQTRKPPSTDPQEIQNDWHEGKMFRVYRYQIDISRESTLKLIMSGFTHVIVVYQRADLSVTACAIQLASHMPEQPRPN
jgi:hypothetical protein